MEHLCSVNDIAEGQSRGFDIGERSLFVVCKDASWYAYENSCPHLGTPLEWQEDKFLDGDAELIQCASHGALFVIESGECVYGPCIGRKLQAIDIVIQDEDIYLA